MGDAGGSTVTITASGPVEKTSEEDSPVEALEGEFGSWPRYDRGPVNDPVVPARAGVPTPEREEGGVRRTGDALRGVRGEDPAAPWEPWDDPAAPCGGGGDGGPSGMGDVLPSSGTANLKAGEVGTVPMITVIWGEGGTSVWISSVERLM